MSEKDKMPRNHKPDPLEARLADYGAVLREEAELRTGKIAGFTVGGAGLYTEVGIPERGASTDQQKRGNRWRSGVLVAAVLALIAGVGVFSLRPNNDGATVEVASAPATAATSAVQDGSGEGGSGDSQDESAEETTGEPSDDPDQGEANQGDRGDDGQELETAGGTDPTEDGPENADPAEPEAEDPDLGEPDAVDPEPESELVCEVGELVGDQCQVVGDPPVNGPPTCPVSATVFVDDEGCYEIIEPSATCDGLQTYDANNCRRSVALVAASESCPADYTLRSADRTCVLPGTSRTLCSEGTLTNDGRCEIARELPEPTGVACPTSDDHVEIDGTCFFIEQPDCGDMEPGPNPGECIKLERVDSTIECTSYPMLEMVDGQCGTTSPGVEYCEEGHFMEGSYCYEPVPYEEEINCPGVFFDGECYDVVGVEEDGSCESGQPAPGGNGCLVEPEVPYVDAGPVCVYEERTDPETGEAQCVVEHFPLINCDEFAAYPPYPNYDPSFDGTTCAYLVGPPVEVLTCYIDLLTVDRAEDCFTIVPTSCFYDDCLRPLQTAVLPPPCSHDGFEPSVNGCVRYEAPAIECVEGELDLDGLSCVIIGETLPVPGFVCPQDDDVIDDGVSCYELIPRNDCGDLSELPSSAGDGPRCRRTVNLVPGPLACKEGFAFQAGQCVRFLQPG